MIHSSQVGSRNRIQNSSTKLTLSKTNVEEKRSRRMMIALLFLIVLHLSLMDIVAFVTTPLRSRQITSLQMITEGEGYPSRNFTSANSSNKTEKTSFDVEYARQQLENLLSNSKDESGINSDEADIDIATKPSSFSFSKILSEYEAGADFSLSSFPTPPPLSSIDRDRRLVEIQLLGYLTEGDDVVSELWSHWYSERGSTAKARLEEIGGMFTDPKNWDKCEKDLIELVDEYGIYFTEPINLLATLYFLQGKLELSYKLCEIVLTFKPYHIGALSGIVQVTLGLNDLTESRKWARKRLPKSSLDPVLGEGGALDDRREPVQQLNNPERIKWVEKAVTAAKAQLAKAEQRTKENFFGKPDAHYDIMDDRNVKSDVAGDFDHIDGECDDSVWQ